MKSSLASEAVAWGRRRRGPIGGFLILLLSVVRLSAAGDPVPAEGLSPAVSPTASVAGQRLLIVGSSTIAPLIGELADRFRAGHSGLEILVEAAGSGRGAKDTLSGRADIGMVARPLKATEQALFVIPIARDGAALVVNRRNPVEELTREQARGIFSGRIDNWKVLGGPARPIELLTRARSQGVTAIVTRYLDLAAGGLKLSEEVVLNHDVVKAVTSRPDTLSILSIGVVEHAVERGIPIKALTLDGVKPGSDSIRNGDWPMARSLTLVTRTVPTGAARDFLRFVLSPDSRAVIESHDFVPY